MTTEEEILSNIGEAVESYSHAPLSDYHTLSEILRLLTANLFYLEKYRTEAYARWHSVYINSSGTSNAARAQEADREVLELYQYRRLMTSAYKIVDALRSQISIAKKEN